jgi:diguanylate cyclase (GGDEF)-like protein
MGSAADPSLRLRECLAAVHVAALASLAVAVSGLLGGWTIVEPGVIAFLAVTAAVAALQAIEFAPNMHYDSADPVIVLAAVIGGPFGGALAGAAASALFPGQLVTRSGYAASRVLQGTCAGAVVVGFDLRHGTTASAVAAALAAEVGGTICVFATTAYLALRRVIELDRRVVLTNLFDPALGTPLVAGLALAHARAGAGALVLLIVPAVLAATAVRLVRERWRLRHAESEARALRDPLTGAYNRRWFEDAVAAGLEESVGLVLLDLDHFKAVNDAHGHAAGDVVLVESVRRLSARVRPGDGVVRWGGEELAVLLLNVGDGADLAARAEELRRTIGDAPFVVDGVEIAVTASAGAATPAGDADTLVRAADAALYDAKRAGRNRAVLV